VQTRPGNEPERDPQEPEEAGATGPAAGEGEGEERDPFTPKVRPSGEDGESGAGEETPEAEASGEEPDLAETLDLRSLKPETPETPETSETPETPETPERPEEPEEPEKPAAETAGKRERSVKHRGEKAAETVKLPVLGPEEQAAETSGEPAAESESGEPEEPATPDTAETVNLRELLPEASAASADETPGEQEKGAEPEPPVRRRTPAEGEPPRRRPVPGGQPPRRPGPGPDPRRMPGPPHAGDPRRRPPVEHAPERRPAPAAAAAPSAPPTPSAPSVSLGRRRLFAALWPPRLSRNQVVVGVLLAALGAALAIQVHATNTSDEILRGARADDLVNILDEVTSRGQSLDAELRNLQTQNAAIQDSADKAQAALAQAQQKAKDLQILAGTVKAKGPGITMTITDPQGQLKSATLLNALEELRAAGAEVVQVDDVRVVVSSSFVDTPDGGIALDGHELSKPYVYKVIGDPNTLAPAMQIPGGVVANVKAAAGANATIASGQVLVDAVAPLPNPAYAKAG
jgi:uncharacterized protein YlxW (UPF0749 family)